MPGAGQPRWRSRYRDEIWIADISGGRILQLKPPSTTMIEVVTNLTGKPKYITATDKGVFVVLTNGVIGRVR